MGNIGFWEIIILAAVALVVIGPEKFPDFAKLVLRAIKDIKGYVNEVRDELTEELRPVNTELRKLSKYDPETYIDALTKGPVASKHETTKPNEPVSNQIHGGAEESGTANATESLSPTPAEPGQPEQNEPTDESPLPRESVAKPRPGMPADGYDHYDD